MPSPRTILASASNPTPSVFGGLGSFNTLGVAELKPLAAAPLEAARAAPARASTFGEVDDEIDAIDAVDLELFPIFEEEAQELLPKLDGQLRDWLGEPANNAHASACMRTLHTLKGGARLAGAMRLGEMAHRLETRIERLTATDAPAAKAEDVEALQAVSDAMTSAFEALRSRDAQAYSDAVAAATAPVAPSARPSEPARAPIAEAPVFVATPIVPTPAEAAPPVAETKKGDKVDDASARTRPWPCAADRSPRRSRRCLRPSPRRSTGRASRAKAAAPSSRSSGRWRRSRRCASARRCSTASSTRPARSASRARASNRASARSRDRSPT